MPFRLRLRAAIGRFADQTQDGAGVEYAHTGGSAVRSARIGFGGVFSLILSRRFVIILATVCLPAALIMGSACGPSKSATKPSVSQNETAVADELTALRQQAAVADELTALRQKAAAGDALAQNKVGLTYLTGFYPSEDPHKEGLHLTKDEAHAAQWFRKAAEQGLPEAQNQLGAMYLHGRGVPKDYTQALVWFVKAAEQGYPEAHLQLGAVYFAGRGGVAKDNVEALKRLTIASTLETRDLRSSYVELEERITKEMTPPQVAEAKRRAHEWLAAFERRQK